MSAEEQLSALKKEFEAFKTEIQSDLFTLQRNQSSRRGLDGASIKGDRGDRGTDAVVKIVQDGQTIRVLSNQGQAEIITIPIAGKDGKDGAPTPPAKDGRDGRDGVSPSISEIVQAVIQEFKTRWARL